MRRPCRDSAGVGDLRDCPRRPSKRRQQHEPVDHRELRGRVDEGAHAAKGNTEEPQSAIAPHHRRLNDGVVQSLADLIFEMSVEFRLHSKNVDLQAASRARPSSLLRGE